MNNTEAIVFLRMSDGLFAMAMKKSDASDKAAKEFIDNYHEAINLACDALALFDDTSLDIDGGKK